MTFTGESATPSGEESLTPAEEVWLTVLRAMTPDQIRQLADHLEEPQGPEAEKEVAATDRSADPPVGQLRDLAQRLAPDRRGSLAPGGSSSTRKSPTPAGKIKASFNLLPNDIDSLRAMSARLGTTVTNVLQRAIRDERFVQDQLARGNSFAVVDQKGSVREIIWR